MSRRQAASKDDGVPFEVNVHPIISQIINRDCHVGESNKTVVRHVISKLKHGIESFRKMTLDERTIFIDQCIFQHRYNYKEYVEVMSGFTRTTAKRDSEKDHLGPLTGEQIVALMRKHKTTIEQLAFRQGVPVKRVREIREQGLDEAPVVRDWIKAISGEDPGPMPEKYRVNNRQEEGDCCFCGYPLYVGDTPFEYIGSMFCSIHCCRKSRNW